MTEKHSTTEETSKVESYAMTENWKKGFPTEETSTEILRQAQCCCGVGTEHRKRGLSYGTLIVGLAGHRFYVI